MAAAGSTGPPVFSSTQSEVDRSQSRPLGEEDQPPCCLGRPWVDLRLSPEVRHCGVGQERQRLQCLAAIGAAGLLAEQREPPDGWCLEPDLVPPVEDRLGGDVDHGSSEDGLRRRVGVDQVLLRQRDAELCDLRDEEGDPALHRPDHRIAVLVAEQERDADASQVACQLVAQDVAGAREVDRSQVRSTVREPFATEPGRDEGSTHQGRTRSWIRGGARKSPVIAIVPVSESPRVLRLGQASRRLPTALGGAGRRCAHRRSGRTRRAARLLPGHRAAP